MRTDAPLLAVFTTLRRATMDAAIPVVLRTRHPAQAHALAQWLLRAHGSARTVIASPTAGGLIEVRLPPRRRWPDPAA